MDNIDKQNRVPKKCKSENVKSSFTLFCEISSIRGMHKISKAPTLFLKVLWTSFVLCMIWTLFVMTGLLIKDYLNYYTAWHVRTKFDDNSDLPAITLCSHNPFSLAASRQWQNKRSYSPQNFRDRLREIVRDSVNNSNAINQLSLMMFNDKIETFYSNLNYYESLSISHGEDMLSYCAIYEKHRLSIVKNCRDTTKDTSLEKLIFSNRKYFNCWTLQKKVNSTSHSIDSLIIMVSLTPTTDIPQLKDAFLMDILERGEGLKLVIHEPNTYPDIEQEGIDVQPGKMNNIKYEPVRWARRSTPVQKCINGQAPLIDLTRYFNYTFTFCMETNLQIELIKACGCMSSLYPRPYIPNEKVGYCLDFVQNNISKIRSNIDCAHDFMRGIKDLKTSWENVRCTQRCNYFTYTSELSITKWVPSLEKIELISNLINESEQYLSNYTNVRSKNQYMDFINYRNKTEGRTDANFEREDKFTYISLTRKTGNTVIKDEQLTLDLAILVSRIGGLCSLFIGLTVSFFVELIEFIYILCQPRQVVVKATTLPRNLNVTKCHNCELNVAQCNRPLSEPHNAVEMSTFITVCDSANDQNDRVHSIWSRMDDNDDGQDKVKRSWFIESPLVVEI